MFFYNPKILPLLFVIFTMTTVVGAQTTEQAPIYLNDPLITPEQQSRLNHASNVYQMVKDAGNYITSTSKIFTEKELPLPVGVQPEGSKYCICIEEIYRDSLSWAEIQYIKAVCVIPLHEGDSIGFEGIVRIESNGGVGDRGKLALIAPQKIPLGSESSIIIDAGSSVSFDCNGFREVQANLTFNLNSDRVYCVDDSGKRIGALSLSTSTTFTDINDFMVTFNSNDRLGIDGLDGFSIAFNGVTLDHSYDKTPTIVNFPTGYFSNNDDVNLKAWRGVALSRAKVTLPSFISAKSDTTSTAQKNRITLDLSNVIIDGDGLSCHTEADGLVSDKTLDPDKWGMSVQHLEFTLLRNRVTMAGFEGKINIPPFGKNSLLDYTAAYDQAARRFLFESTLGGQKEFPLLFGKVTFDETSRIHIEVVDNDVYPAIMANGIISINAPLKDDTTKNCLKLPDIRFEGMRISREAPVFDIGTVALTGEGHSPNIAGFQLTVNSINSVKSGNETGLDINAEVNLTEKFGGKGDVSLFGDTKRWKFNKVRLNSIDVQFDANAFSLDGGVAFAYGDEVYGDGFRGDFKMKIVKKIDLDAVAVFGRKDGERYFMTDAFLEVEPKSGVKLPPALSFYGVGGGLYRHMNQDVPDSGSDFGRSLSGINYVPDLNVGMGFMARTKFCLANSPDLMNADVGLEMQFNNSWGVNFVQFRGDVTMITPVNNEGMQTSLNKLKSLKDPNSVDGKSSVIKGIDDLEVGDKGNIRAVIDMRYNLNDDVFDADMKTYLNIANVLKGKGPNDMLGEASAHFGADGWHTYIGEAEKSKRIGVSLIDLVEADGYFMTGSEVPELPAPPEQVIKSLSPEYVQELSSRNENEKLAAGGGIAFGAGFDMEFNAELFPFYAHLGLGVGSEFLLKRYSESVHCKGSSEPLGISGWYAKAQAWAWANANIGMKITLFHKTHKYEIIKASMAAYLRGEGPNPFYFTGAVGGDFRILGGLVKGHCNFDFEIGDKCIKEGGSPFGEDVIAQLTPADREKDVNVFTAPQLVLNVPAGQEMTIEEDDGSENIYRIHIDEFSLTNQRDNSSAKMTNTSSKDGRVITYKPEEPLESQQLYKLHAKVSFEKKSGNTWTAVKDVDGNAYTEEKLIEFTSGERPKNIMPEHVIYAYPADRQYNFLSEEYTNAYFITSENYSYLFAPSDDYGQEIKLSTFGGQTTTLPFTTTTDVDAAGGRFEIDIPIENIPIKQNEIYNLTIVNVPKYVATADKNIVTDSVKMDTGNSSDINITTHAAEGDLAMLEQTEIYSIDFRTSSYKTFGEKIEKMRFGRIILDEEYPKVHSLSVNFIDNSSVVENFDLCEYNPYDIAKGILKLSPVYEETPWYTTYVAPLLYKNADMTKVLGDITPPTSDVVVNIGSVNTPETLSETILNTNGRLLLNNLSAMYNEMQHFIDEDFTHARTVVSNTLVNDADRSEGVKLFMKQNNLPATTNGAYPIVMRYTLPGKNIVTSEIIVNTKLTE